MRYEPVPCSNVTCGHLLERSVVRQRLKEGKTFAFCNDCREKLTLPAMVERIQLGLSLSIDQARSHRKRRYSISAFGRSQSCKVHPKEFFLSSAWA